MLKGFFCWVFVLCILVFGAVEQSVFAAGVSGSYFVGGKLALSGGAFGENLDIQSSLSGFDGSGLLSSGKEYVDRYVWSGALPHGTVGLGIQDHRSEGLPWYSTALGVAGGGLHAVPVGGKVYDGLVEPTPGVNFVYGAPGAQGGVGPVRIKSVVFQGVSHLTRKGYCQALRLVLYGDGSLSPREHFETDGTPTKDVDVKLVDGNKMANTAQVWFWTMPMCGSGFIPVGGDGAFAHVNGLELTLVDRDLPAVLFDGEVVGLQQRWMNRLTGSIAVGVVGRDGGSGVQRLKAKLVGPGVDRMVVERQVACDYRHLGAPWNMGKPWLGQVCPNEFRVDTRVNVGELTDGVSTFTADTTDLSGQSSESEKLELWVDRTLPSVRFDSSASSLLKGWGRGERSIDLPVVVRDGLSGVKRVSLFARRGAGEPQLLAERVLCAVSGVKAQCSRQAQQSSLRFDPSVLTDGKTVVYVEGEDLAGNRARSDGVEVALDRQPPTEPKQVALTLSRNNELTARWNAAFDSFPASGVARYRYRYQVDDRPVSTWRETTMTSAARFVTVRQGSRVRFWVQAVDNAGNVSQDVVVEKTISAPQPGSTPGKPPSPCSSQKPCPPKPPVCKGKQCKKKPVIPKKPCRKKRCAKKTKLPVDRRLAPCLKKKPKGVLVRGRCRLNVWVRGIDVSQGPAGAQFNGEQKLPRRTNPVTVDYRQNAVSRFFDMDRLRVDTGYKSKKDGSAIMRDDFVVKGDYWAAPRLVADKPTVVRVYTAFNGSPVAPAAQVLLIGYRRSADGRLINLGSVTSRPVLTPASDQSLVDLRGTVNGATMFILPSAWLAPTFPGQQLVVQATVKPEQVLKECADCHDQANTLFINDIVLEQPLPGRTDGNQPTPALPITVFKLIWNGSENAPADIEIKDAFTMVNTVYPLPDGALKPTINDETLNLGVIPKNDDKGWDCLAIVDAFKNRLREKTKDYLLPSWEKENDYGQINFRADRPWPRYVGMMGGGTDCGGRASVRGRTGVMVASGLPVAHELGHNYNREHASDAHEESGGIQEGKGMYASEPWPDNYLFGSEHGSINGFSYGGFLFPQSKALEQLTGSVKSGLTATGFGTGEAHPHELMSYGDWPGSSPIPKGWEPKAVSPNTWNALLDGFDRLPVCALNACPFPFPPEGKGVSSGGGSGGSASGLHIRSRVVDKGKRVSGTVSDESTPGTVVVVDGVVGRDRVVQVGSRLYGSGGRPVVSPVIDSLLEVPVGYRSDSVEGSPYRFVAYDVDDRPVSELRVDPPVLSSEVGGDVSGKMFLPGSAVRIRLLYEDRVLAERVASANPPQVKLFSPVAGERWFDDGRSSAGGRAAMRWDVSDPDGDELHIVANYLADGKPVGGLSSPDRDGEVVNVRQFKPSKAGQVDLLVSDGWYTVEVLGPAFTVDPHPFPSSKIYLMEPKKEFFPLVRKDPAFMSTEFYAQADDPNIASVIDDNYPKPGYPYRWYLNGKLLSRRQRFTTGALGCVVSPAKMVVTVRGSYGRVGRKAFRVPLSPKKPPKVCRKKKKRKKVK